MLKQFDGRADNAKQNKPDLTLNVTQREAAADVGMSLHQQRTAVRVANVPADTFEREVESPAPRRIRRQGDAWPCSQHSGSFHVAFDYIVVFGYILAMKEVTYTRAATKVLRKLPRNTAELIMAKVDQYAAEPESLANNVTALKGREGVRLRVGDWRVIMDDGVVLAVLDVGPRGGIYG